MRGSDERFRRLVEGIEDHALFVLDPAGKVASWNAGARAITGYEAHEIEGKPFLTLYPLEAIESGAPEHALSAVRREGRFEDQGRRVRKDGSSFWAHQVVTALRDESGELVGFATVVRDLSDRHRSEAAFRQSEERFRLLVESVRDYAIFMLDPEGHIVSWNVGAERIKGYQASEIIGQHFSRFYPEDAARRGWPEHELRVARREGRFEDEGYRLRKDGSAFWANVVITALFDDSGQLQGFAKITRDLTERRKVEALEEEGRRLNEFLAMLGHELRNPLAPIRHAAGLLALCGPEDERRIRWAREVIERQVSHLAHIVDDLLDLGRINSGKISVRRVPLDLAALAAKCVEGMRPEVDAKGQELVFSEDGSPVPIVGDPTRLSQVVMNLLSNAHKYTPEGGHITVTVERDGAYAQLNVRDDGSGISPALLPTVFEPFVQGERALDRSEGGLGIGLSLVKRLVRLHDGTVSATSGGLGQGTELVVRLPISEGPSDPISAEDASPAESLRRRVLVVDDNVDARESLAMLLDLWGHEVFTADDGLAALEAVAAHRPELVLLDIGLPGIDGYEVAERLRGEPCALVAMTGYGQDEDVARARRAGFVEHLVKPFDAARVARLLADLPAGG